MSGVRRIPTQALPDGSMRVGRLVVRPEEMPHVGHDGPCNDRECHRCDPLRQRMFAAGSEYVARLARQDRRSALAARRRR
jgi:hypothetical protein